MIGRLYAGKDNQSKLLISEYKNERIPTTIGILLNVSSQSKKYVHSLMASMKKDQHARSRDR